MAYYVNQYDELLDSLGLEFDEATSLMYHKNQYILRFYEPFDQDQKVELNAIKNSVDSAFEIKISTNEKFSVKYVKGCDCNSELILAEIETLVENGGYVTSTTGLRFSLCKHYLLYSPGDDDPPLPRKPLNANGSPIKIKPGTIKKDKKYESLENKPDRESQAIVAHADNKKPIVAIMDTGIDLFYWNEDDCPLHWIKPDKCGVDDLVYGKNFIEGSEGFPNRPFDNDETNKHGTRIAKIIANQSENNVELLILKVFGHEGSASFFDIFCGFEFCINNKVNIINASWGYYGFSFNLFEEYIERLDNANIWLVNAAGNSADFKLDTPRDLELIFVSSIANARFLQLKRYPAYYSNELGKGKNKIITVTTIRKKSNVKRTVTNDIPLLEISLTPAENYSSTYVDAGVGAGFDGEFRDPISNYDYINFRGIERISIIPTIKGSSYATAHFVGLMAKNWNTLNGFDKEGIISDICNPSLGNADIGVRNNQLVNVENFM
jgi:hypothetical protein